MEKNMIIRITENELKQIVDKTVNHYLANRSFFEEKYNTDRSYISEGLTCSYNIGKVKNILFRKYDFKNLGIQWGEADMNPNQKIYLHRCLDSIKKSKTPIIGIFSRWNLKMELAIMLR